VSDKKTRCWWAGTDPESEYCRYHDEEWGVPVHDEATHLEFLILEGAQAGLNWRTILNRRDGYRRAFCGFDAPSIARMTEKDEVRLLQDEGIIRNKAKIRSAIGNARAFLIVQEEFGTFDSYIWRFVDGVPIQNHFTRPEQIPVTTPLAEALSKDLKTHGFSFVGPTIIYAHMQAIGMVNDHLVSCFRHDELCPT
jgi:DNA-3-methyladenine glycosylase I